MKDDTAQEILHTQRTFHDVMYSEESIPGYSELDIDKSWHGIHFLLTGEAWGGDSPPLDFLLAGGTSIDGSDSGYGPARYYSPDEVVEIVQALEPHTSETLREDFDAETFTAEEVYPAIWDEPKETCLDEYLLVNFEAMKTFLAQAGETGNALVVHYT